MPTTDIKFAIFKSNGTLDGVFAAPPANDGDNSLPCSCGGIVNAQGVCSMCHKGFNVHNFVLNGKPLTVFVEQLIQDK